MRSVKYVGNADERIVRASDFSDSGIDKQEEVVFRGYGATAQMKNDAADFLLALPEFVEEGSKEDTEPEPGTTQQEPTEASPTP